MKQFFIFIFSVLIGINLLAIDESHLDKINSERLVSYLSTYGKKDYFIGVDDKKINYYILEANNPKGVIIISPGNGEAALRYSEFIFDIKDLGYTVYIIDHRGQGESDRLLDDKTKSHVVNFSDYVDDFSQFVNTVVMPQNYRNSFIFAHSMGGAIASGFLVRFPKTVTGVILSAPMLEINTGLGSLAMPITGILHRTSDPAEYAPTQKPYDSENGFNENKLTSSSARFVMMRQLYNRIDKLQVGGTTINWLKQSLDFTAKLRKTPNIYQVPTLLFQAGKDKLVVANGQNMACEKLSHGFCKIVKFEDSEHEILNEKDTIRNRALAILKDFIKSFEK